MTLPVFKSNHALDGYGIGQRFILEGSEAHHAFSVRRLKPGQWLDVVDGDGNRIRTQILSGDSRQLVLAIESCDHDPKPSVSLTLVQALAKSDRDMQAVEMCTELGVDEIVAWQADRSIARFRADRQEKQRDKWRNTIAAAAKQSRRSRWPVLWDPVETSGLVRLISDTPHTSWFVLHEQASDAFYDVLHQSFVGDDRVSTERIAIVVGPEGGISDTEVAMMCDAGARTVRLGDEVLRSSTAGAAALVILNIFTKRWR